MSTSTPPVALVTGSTRGIGLHTARQLGEAGLHVLVNGRDPHRVDEVAAELRASGLSASSLPFDVTDATEVEQAAKRVEHTTGHLDVLVNNAGVRVEQYHRQPSQQPLTDWRTTFESNLFGVVSTTLAFLPLLRAAPAARIVNVSSLLGSVTTHTDRSSYAYSDMFKSLPAYSASKSAVNSWTVHLAYELRDSPIKVNSAHPGYTRTDMNDGAGDQSAAEGARTAVGLALLSADGPSGTFGHLDTVVPW